MQVENNSDPNPHASLSTRKLGHGYSLALKINDRGLHLTLVYFYKCRRGYEQDLVKSMCQDYFIERNITEISVEMGEVYGERSVRLRGQVLEQILVDLRQVFASFDIVQNQTPHVDLRGQGAGSLPETIHTIGNFYI